MRALTRWADPSPLDKRMAVGRSTARRIGASLATRFSFREGTMPCPSELQCVTSQPKSAFMEAISAGLQAR
jgi:hypothetical protein